VKASAKAPANGGLDRRTIALAVGGLSAGGVVLAAPSLLSSGPAKEARERPARTPRQSREELAAAEASASSISARRMP